MNDSDAPPSVLDASAVLAALYRETGSEVASAELPHATISAVNWCEVVQHAVSSEADAHELRDSLESEGLTIVPFTAERAAAAAALRSATRARGLSLADRACLALARELDVPAYTADRAWSKLELELEIRLIR